MFPPRVRVFHEEETFGNSGCSDEGVVGGPDSISENNTPGSRGEERMCVYTSPLTHTERTRSMVLRPYRRLTRDEIRVVDRIRDRAMYPSYFRHLTYLLIYLLTSCREYIHLFF